MSSKCMNSKDMNDKGSFVTAHACQRYTLRIISNINHRKIIATDRVIINSGNVPRVLHSS